MSVAPDPALWSLVPSLHDAAGWLESLAAELPPETADNIRIAGHLALQAKSFNDDGLVLLLAQPESNLYGTATVFTTAAMPAATDDEAKHIALQITPSPWEAAAVPFTLNGQPAWRVSVLAPVTEDEALASTPSVVVTTYVIAVADRLTIVQLSPMGTTAGALAQALVEQFLPTIEVNI